MNKRLLLGSVAGLLAMGLAATPAYAQRGGGGRGYSGGGGGGGRSFSGSYGSGYGGYGGYGRGYNNNWGGYGNNWNGGYGRGYGVGIGLGYGASYYGGTYSNGYYGTPNSYAYGTYADQQPVMSPGLSNYQVNPNPTGPSMAMQSYYSGPSSPSGSAQLNVKVPADAQLWLGPMESSQQGIDRQFSFPSLPAGDNLFTLRATWNENGQTVTRERQVNVKGGENATVDLTKSASENTKPSNPNVGHPSDTNTSGQKITPPAKPNTGTDQ